MGTGAPSGQYKHDCSLEEVGGRAGPLCGLACCKLSPVQVPDFGDNKQIYQRIETQTRSAFSRDPDYKRKTLVQLNSEASALHRDGLFCEALGAYAKLFAKAREFNLVHGEQFTCYSNRAAAYLAVRLITQTRQAAQA